MKKTSTKLFTILLERLIKSGLPLASPYAEMIWKKQKTLIIKGNEMNLSQFTILCDYNKKAFGFIRCRQPKEVNLREFKALEPKHRINELKRKKLWPNSESFFSFEIRDFFPFTQPRKITKLAQKDKASVREVIFKRESFDAQAIAEEIKTMDNDELPSLHIQVHRFWENRGSDASDELSVKTHLLVTQEMKRRGLEHKTQESITKRDKQIGPKVVSTSLELTKMEIMKALHQD